jgi:lysophospholipid acyltransferase (LPLAT)-like uncharacterized protein
MGSEMKLTGILLVGFLGFVVQLLTQITTNWSWFKQDTDFTKNMKQLVSIFWGEVIAIAILIYSPDKSQILVMFGANVGVYVDAVLSGLLYSFGGNLAHMLIEWINDNKDVKITQNTDNGGK